MTSPYEPPKAAVSDVERLPGSPVKGIVYGVLIDVGGSLVLGLAVMLLYGIVLAASGVPPEEMEKALTNVDPLSWVSLVGNVMGMGVSFLGGYVCARVAFKDEYKWAGVVAVISFISGFLFGMSAYSIEWNLLLALVSAGAVMAGARSGARRNARTT